MFVATSALAVVSLLAISYAKEVLMIGEKNFGYLVIAAGVGMFFGTAFLSRLSHYFKKTTIVTSSFIVSGLSLFFIAMISDIKLSLALIFILGLCNILINSSIQTILQSETTSDVRGRVFGFQNMLINSAFTFPLLIFGAVADFWGIRTALATLGATMILTGFIGMLGKGFKTSL
jgi:predicted MFS family arabinose efflux permease